MVEEPSVDDRLTRAMNPSVKKRKLEDLPGLGLRAAAIGACELTPMMATDAVEPWEYDGLLEGKPVRVLFDSGAAANFLSAKVAESMGLPLTEPHEDDVGFARMPNGARSECKATRPLQLRIGGHRDNIAFNVTPPGGLRGDPRPGLVSSTQPRHHGTMAELSSSGGTTQSCSHRSKMHLRVREVPQTFRLVPCSSPKRSS